MSGGDAFSHRIFPSSPRPRNAPVLLELVCVKKNEEVGHTLQNSLDFPGKLFAVEAKGGYAGRGRYIPITFAVKAPSAKEAASLVKGFPRVKKNRKDSIMSVSHIGPREFFAIKKSNADDGYFKSHSVQEQRALVPDFEERIVEESDKYSRIRPSAPESLPHKTVYHSKTRVSNPRTYIRMKPDVPKLSYVGFP
jgi:hypothetical protein